MTLKDLDGLFLLYWPKNLYEDSEDYFKAEGIFDKVLNVCSHLFVLSLFWVQIKPYGTYTKNNIKSANKIY